MTTATLIVIFAFSGAVVLIALGAIGYFIYKRLRKLKRKAKI